MTKYDKGLHVEIGKQLKEARIKKGMSLQNVSDAIGGIKTKQTIMRYENGTTRIDEPVMEKVCAALGLNVNEVVKKAEFQRALNTHYSIKSSMYRNTLSMFSEQDDGILTAYKNADEKTKRAVRILLGLE